MKKIKVILVLFILLVGCKTRFDFSKDIKCISKLEISTITLSLLKNGRFQYRNVEELTNQYSSGTWTLAKKNIYLKSDESFKTGIISFQEQTVDSDKVIIEILDVEESPIPSVVVLINNNDKLGFESNNKGVLSFPLEKVETITFYYLSEKYNYEVKNSSTNYFKLNLKIDDRSTLYFDNEIWNIDNNKIISPFKRVFKVK